MSPFTQSALAEARESILSTIRKNEKARETLSAKQPPRSGQVRMITKRLHVLYTASALIAGETPDCTEADLAEAVQTLPSFIEQIEKVTPKFAEGTPQHTLAIRRIRAYQIALAIAERALFY